VDPLNIRVLPNAKPCRTKQRKYELPQRAFISATIRALEGVRAVYANPKARWASPALAVPKPRSSEKFRFTVDFRGPNKEIIPVASAMPDLESLYQSTAVSTAFAKLDMCHAYWQVPLHKDSQEVMSIQTPVGVYTSTRILQGSTDAGNHFQATTSNVFRELNEKLIQWLDDFLAHARDEADLLRVLR